MDDRNRTARHPLTLRGHLLRLTLVVLLPALLAGGWTAWELAHAYRRVVETALRGGARTLAITIDREIEVAVTAVASFAASRALRQVAEADDVLPQGDVIPELYERARAVGDAFGGWVVLVRADGRQVFNTQRPLGLALPMASGLPWVEQATRTGRPAVSNLFTGSVTQRPVLAAVAPVFPPGPRQGEAPAPLAVILAFDPARLAALLALVRDGEVAGLIQSRDGTIIARSVGHAAAVGQRAPDWVATALRGGGSGLISGPSLEGRPIVAAAQALERVPWSVVVTAPRDSYEATWWVPLERLALGGAVLLAAALLMAGLLARRLLGPVRALVREAEAVAAEKPVPPAETMGLATVAEFDSLRRALTRAAEATRARAVSEGRAAAAEEAAAALRIERDRARLYFDVAHAMLVVLEPDGTVRSINRHGLSVLGLEREEEVVGRDWFGSFLPERLRDHVRIVFDGLAAGRGDAPGSYENPVLRADGEERLIAWRNTVLRDAAGRLLAVVASGEDITGRRAAEARQTLLMGEVDHRAKNALAVVQSIVRLTRADRQQDFATAVEGRVNALARAHTLLARERWGGGDLRELLETELAAYSTAQRVRLEGPAVRLSPEAVQPVSLVVHELATNAAKHGSLSADGGMLTVRWAMLPGGALRLEWQEDNARPPVTDGPPTHRGFGSRMIEATVAGQLGGTLGSDWSPSGLRCTITLAADRVARRDLPIAGQEPAGTPAAAAERLAGRRILLVEDEPLVAMDVEEALRSLGCQVIGPAATLAEAMRLAEGAVPLPDAAVLDVNLGGQAAFPVADLLVRQNVPVVFATGYSELPGGWTSDGGQGRTALLRKPVDRAALAAALAGLILAGNGEAARAGRPPPGEARRACL